jgi:ABC-type transport system involved in cytochrome c biogenesis permease component
MTFLPIVERELRVAARRPGTYRTRRFAAMGIMAVWLLLFAVNRRVSAVELNKTLFVALGILALGGCLLAGIFLTADCLSEEKREGTLGLLFLTDLRGYDVVLGKLVATSVHSVYGLLAMLPVLALPLMMGGVTVGEFWRVVLMLVATLFLSLSMRMVALEATRQLSEDRRSGALELLLATPLPEAQILSGQKQALRRRSQGLQRVLLAVNVCMCLAVLARPKQLSMSPRDQAIFLELFLGGILALFVDFKALQTVGMWMALRARRHHRAVLGTLGRVMLVPWAGIFMLVFLEMIRTFHPSEGGLAATFALWFMGGIVTDLVFSAQARAGLERGLRFWVAGAETADRRPFHAHEPSALVELNA